MEDVDPKIEQAIKKIRKHLAKRKKQFSSKEYPEYLERFVITVLKEAIERGRESEKHKQSTELVLDELFVLMERDAKFKGKKVSSERAKIYKEIEEKYVELNEDGAKIGYSTAVNIIAKKHGKSADKLYRAFKKYQNRRYAKSKVDLLP
jgi:hypothetical protein